MILKITLEKIDSIVKENDFSDTAAIIGPLISSNFDYLSTKSKLKNVPKIAPLSTSPFVCSGGISVGHSERNFTKGNDGVP